MLGIEPRAGHMIGKLCTIDLCSRPPLRFLKIINALIYLFTFETKSHYVAQSDLEHIVILLPQLSWDYRHAALLSAPNVLFFCSVFTHVEKVSRKYREFP